MINLGNVSNMDMIFCLLMVIAIVRIEYIAYRLKRNGRLTDKNFMGMAEATSRAFSLVEKEINKIKLYHKEDTNGKRKE